MDEKRKQFLNKLYEDISPAEDIPAEEPEDEFLVEETADGKLIAIGRVGK